MFSNETVRLATNFVDTLVMDRSPELWRNILLNIESKGLMIMVIAVIEEMSVDGRIKFTQTAQYYRAALLEPVNGKTPSCIERFYQLLDIMTLSYHGKY
jgi:hypothetical protein